MEQHDVRRSLSVYAVLAIAGLLVIATVWLCFKLIDWPHRPLVRDPLGGHQSAVEVILPATIGPPTCEELRPCS